MLHSSYDSWEARQCSSMCASITKQSFVWQTRKPANIIAHGCIHGCHRQRHKVEGAPSTDCGAVRARSSVARPRSPILTTPWAPLMKMLSHFRSRWMMGGLWPWR